MKLPTMRPLLLPALLIATVALARPAAAQDGATRVATANPSKILAEMQETKDKNKAVAAEQESLKAQEEQKIKDIQNLKKQRDEDKFHTKNSPEWKELTNQILKQGIELQTWGELKK